ncbi:VanZ family protein [Caulobacter sp. RHG1]|uniref:VanZ family protein n=1 Tax=Caulobacter sp. (strain RHG1) TaxID=2545762 RepID=UPI0015564225|nr:VanZ family protein [Caulobacter sp. RHG1]NQE63019.1 hypothetical protein [Caulobacter sp. RHG1]
MFKPVHVVTAARIALLVGSLTVATLALGPFQGIEHVIGLGDKPAHAVAFGGLLAISFLAFPRLRRNDLTLAILVLGAAVEIAQLMSAGRTPSLMDWLADAVGVGIVYGVSVIETVRKMAREQGDMTFAQIEATDRRRGRRRPAVAFEPATVQAVAPRFAERAARRFPVR